ncbi:alginate O-acetyltransferase AlgX-related protein [Sphaerisporangium viridialbum]|uniref:alginate O-acetyltransferase AlgX-related protein n=1 Tax=Sphaerisporangium viridialbum TaxID=46189 RepID=UPI003C7279D1
MTVIDIEPEVAGRTSRRRGPWRLAAPLAAVVFFFGPALAFAAGDRAAEIENRKLRDFPALQGTGEFVPDFEAWAVDHLPLRQYAVRGRTMLSERVFGQPPSSNTGKRPAYPRIIEGRDGWLYFGDDVAEACRPVRPVAGILGRLRRLAEIVRKSGRRFVFTVAPDKTTIYPDKLPESFLGERCLTRRKQEFWAALNAARLPGYVDLRAPLERLQRESGKPVYWRTDSHWNERSAALYGMELARALKPDLTRDTRLVAAGRDLREGDLGRLLGTPRSETADRWKLVRDGVRLVRRDDRGAPVSYRVTNASSRAPLFQPRTLLIGDSFTRESVSWIAPYFADLTVLRSDAPAKAGPEQVATQVAESEVVVFEMVERYYAGGHGEMLDDATIAALEKAL